MTYVRSAPDTESLQRLHDTGRFREVVDRYLALDSGSDSDATGLLLAAASAARMGELKRATDWAERALKSFTRNGDERGAIRAINVIGGLEFIRGEINRATRRFEEARSLARRVGDLLMVAKASNNLANIANLRGQVERAIRLYRAALSAYEAAGHHQGASETWHNIALRYRQLGALRDATHAAQQAIQRAERTDRPGLKALCYAGSAEIALERQDYALATEQLETADRLAWAGGDGLLVLEIQRLWALLSLKTGQLERAATAARGVRDAAEARGSALIVADALGIRALALKAIGRVVEAHRERSLVMAAYTELGAVDLLERFQLDWDEEQALPDPLL